MLQREMYTNKPPGTEGKCDAIERLLRDRSHDVPRRRIRRRSRAHWSSERLVACVNVLPPMQSVYRWEGKVERRREHQIVIKTTPRRVGRH